MTLSTFFLVDIVEKGVRRRERGVVEEWIEWIEWIE
jgi:hypothetical protein